MVTCMLVPAFHEFGLIEVMTGVGSPMLNGAALLVPKRVNIQIVRIPFPHSSTRRIYLVTLITSVFDFTILSVSTSRRSTLTLYLPGTVISYILLRIYIIKNCIFMQSIARIQMAGNPACVVPCRNRLFSVKPAAPPLRFTRFVSTYVAHYYVAIKLCLIVPDDLRYRDGMSRSIFHNYVNPYFSTGSDSVARRANRNRKRWICILAKADAC